MKACGADGRSSVSDSLWWDSTTERKKRAGRCVRAGCESEPSEGHVTCAPCRAKIQANRERLRAQRQATERRQAVVRDAAKAARVNRTIRDGEMEFDVVWDGTAGL